MFTPEQARRFYNRFGRKQDTQSFYENPALDKLVESGDFENAHDIVEFGCGTARFALRLFNECLPADAGYRGFDISATMVDISKGRLDGFKNRASVTLTNGSVELPAEDGSCDRFISNYVLDLLPVEQISAVIHEAYRILRNNGLLCVTSLTFGKGAVSRTIIAIWRAIHSATPSLVGGCRPIEVARFISEQQWQIKNNQTVVSWGIPSDVLVARCLK
jgi:ubiquinone/menaquinone biosynthesis C-methylase UbiE